MPIGSVRSGDFPSAYSSSGTCVRDMHALRRLPHGPLAPAIIARRRRRARMPKHRLHRREVHPRVEQVTRERAPAIMRREGCDPRAVGQGAEAS